MTVNAETALSYDHAGKSHRFCSAGCRDAFAAGPAQYLADGLRRR
jgi:YHS domain-containing protein